MRTATVDLNFRDKDWQIAVGKQRLTGAYIGEDVNIVDPDGELVGAARVQAIKDRVVILRVAPETIRDRPSVVRLALGSMPRGARIRDVVQENVSRSRSMSIGLVTSSRS